MSALFDAIKRLYEESRLTENGLSNAVTKGWISEPEKDIILRVETDPEEPTETE